MNQQPARWVMDTSTFTHFCRAGYHDLLRRLAPQGLILIPDIVADEVQAARDRDYDIPSIADLPWVEVGVLSPDEERDQLLIKVGLPTNRGDGPRKHLGECAVIACAIHRNMVAVIDDREARTQAQSRGVKFLTSMAIIAFAYKSLDDVGTDTAERIYEALLATDMRLPRVESFIGWAYEMGLLP